MGPPGPCSIRSGSRYSMSRTCGPRDIISLVIPKVGDNRVDSPLGFKGKPRNRREKIRRIKKREKATRLIRFLDLDYVNQSL
jgi:hypothetical protein